MNIYFCLVSLLQPPPSYEEVIREKTQEQVLFPFSAASSSHPASTTTIATQTDPGSDSPVSQGDGQLIVCL